MKNVNRFHLLPAFYLVIFFVVGFVVTGIINNQLTRQKQITDTKAAGPVQDPQCTSQGGQCQSGKLNDVGKPCTLSSGTPGTIVFNYCPSQGNDIRCCVPQNTSSANAGLTVSLLGIGPNANIADQQREATIKIYDITKSFDNSTFTAIDKLTYDKLSGKFVNPNFNLGPIPNGKYQMVIQIDSYLDKQLLAPTGEKVFSLTGAGILSVSSVEMKPGDLAPGPKGDNHINIIDYNALIGCMNGAPPGACLNKKYSDLNNDGVVDQKDLDLLMLSFGDEGFAFQTDQFKCEPDPACVSGKGSLQLCSLLCSRKTQRG